MTFDGNLYDIYHLSPLAQLWETEIWRLLPALRCSKKAINGQDACGKERGRKVRGCGVLSVVLTVCEKAKWNRLLAVRSSQIAGFVTIACQVRKDS
jgi:hypothetical protein